MIVDSVSSKGTRETTPTLPQWQAANDVSPPGSGRSLREQSFSRKPISSKPPKSHDPQRSSSVKSLNPLRKIFRRSQSHHEPNARNNYRSESPGSNSSREKKIRARGSSFLHKSPHVAAPPPELIQSKSSSALNNVVSHNVNPFIIPKGQGFDQPFSPLGTGVAVAAPRQSFHYSPNPLSRKTSSNESNMVYNPYGTLSKSSSAGSHHDLAFYLQDGKNELPLLPTPLEDPNNYLPDGLKQTSVQLADNFCYPERNSGDDIALGSGGSSEVRTVRSAFHKKDIFALKKFKLLHNEEPQHFYKRCSKEFVLAKTLSHNVHIANTFYLVKVSTTTFMTRGWAFVMEYCSGGDLYSLISRPDWKKKPLKTKFSLWKQVAEGVRFMHSQGIVHRDIKPENVLMTEDGIAKLTDFGISDWSHEDPQDLSSPIRLFDWYVGSPPYSPPEVMVMNDDNATKQEQKPYDAQKMDCWALGMLMFVLVYQSTPFFEAYKSDSKFRNYVLSYNNFIEHINPQFRKPKTYRGGPGSEFQYGREFQDTEASRIAWRLADPDTATRYTMQDLVNDPWWQTIEIPSENEKVTLPKAPELRRTSYDSDNSTSSEKNEATHSSNPFLKKQLKNKSKSMLSIAEDSFQPLTSSGSDKLPTLNEEKTREDGSGAPKDEAHDCVSNGSLESLRGRLRDELTLDEDKKLDQGQKNDEFSDAVENQTQDTTREQRPESAA
ncbi:LAMI_0G03312g1_1 [Lachancea mirantina]|uniref:LAMI_0G03312g1_1 n=1 Tax=Lachancea mirantina TaxID=1230905 RepID=A0A1G4K824_9SACH|nr:LAMI_0G03312g1_1 [Lachancea mirantina]